jgi:hypothetical protein
MLSCCWAPFSSKWQKFSTKESIEPWWLAMQEEYNTKMFHVPQLSILHDVLARCSSIVAFPNSTYISNNFISYTIKCCSTLCEKGLNLNNPCALHMWNTAPETTLHIHKFMKVAFTIERLFKNLPFTKTQIYNHWQVGLKLYSSISREKH